MIFEKLLKKQKKKIKDKDIETDGGRGHFLFLFLSSFPPFLISYFPFLKDFQILIHN